MGWPTKRRKSGRSEEGDCIYDSLGNLVKTPGISINYVSRGQFFFFLHILLLVNLRRFP